MIMRYYKKEVLKYLYKSGKEKIRKGAIYKRAYMSVSANCS